MAAIGWLMVLGFSLMILGMSSVFLVFCDVGGASRRADHLIGWLSAIFSIALIAWLWIDKPFTITVTG